MEQTQEQSSIKTGYSAKEWIKQYFYFTGYRALKFITTVPEAFYIKVDSIDGKKLYSFTYKYCSRVRIRFSISASEEYYIYESDISMFNELSAEEQLNYLSTIILNNMIIGKVNSVEFQKYLYNNYIQLNTLYSGMVTPSYTIPNSYWWTIKSRDVNLSLLSTKLMQYGSDLEIEVEHIKKEKIESNADKNAAMIESLRESSRFMIVTKDDLDPRDANSRNAHKKIVVYARNLKTDNMLPVPLFTVYFVTDLKPMGYGLCDYTNILFAKSMEEVLSNETISKIHNKMVFRHDRFVDNIHLIADDFSNSENEQYRSLGRILMSI